MPLNFFKLFVLFICVSLLSCSTWSLIAWWHVGSQLPDQESKACPPALEREIATGPPGGVLAIDFVAKDINSILVTNEWSFSV